MSIDKVPELQERKKKFPYMPRRLHNILPIETDRRLKHQERATNVLSSSKKLRNIEADLHIHSEFSDGMPLYDITSIGRELGLSTVSIADHVRQRWDDVDFYNKDAYRIKAPGWPKDGEDWILAENMDILEAVLADHATESECGDREGLNLRSSFEQDYERRNEPLIYRFLDKHRPEFVPLSTHYIQLQEWDNAKYFRMDDFDELSDDACARAVENYFDEYESKIDFGNRVEEELNIPVIHTHMDGILRNENLRPHIEDEHFYNLLEEASEEDAVIEANARVMRKLTEEFEDIEGYNQDDAEWFTREVARRAENEGLRYVVSSDAHSRIGFKKNLMMADKVIDSYQVPPLNYQKLVEASSPN